MKSIFYAFLIISAISCNSRSEHPNHGSNPVTERFDGSGEPGCLLRYATSYDQMLTLDEVAGLAGKPSTAVKVNYNKVVKNPAYHEVVYRWETGGPHKVRGVQGAENGIISIRGIRKKDIKRFKNDYKPRTEEETAQIKDEMNEQLDKEFDRKSDNGELAASQQQFKDLGVSKEAGKRTAKAIGNSLSSSLDAYEYVPQLGDAASWNLKDRNLYVLHRGVEFCIHASLEDDSFRSKATAVEAAKLVLNKCK